MQRRGFTLIETLLVIVIIGITMVVAIPRIQAASVKQAVHGGRNTVMGLYAQARATTLQQGRSTALRFDGNKVLVTAAKSVGYDTIGTVRNLTSEFGATVTSTADSIVFNVQGYTTGGTVTIKVARNGYT